ncbi:FAD-binding oxidoreductase [Marinobacter salinisoli]|uniref:FAD-binding oxidoreductase n=1 Tax=Marinobacter salinisoli TaxID=2769486 RepID=A0ABX7MU31_9GAMM|nr:FAD-binding oxidoreductase [Marinobacter salinisoli]QSP94997.1 FAD-binding oxidoreductase [Marinobacter salinisoli]
MMLNPKTHRPTYPDSYYAATKNLNLNLSGLTGDIETEICVIGGGFSGVNAALELSERGHKVVLLEAYQIGWGATGRNGGQVIRGIGEDVDKFENEIGQSGVESIKKMGLEAVDIVRERVKRYNIECDLVMGYCDVAHKPRQLKALEEDKAWLESMGYDHEVRMVAADEMHTIVGSDNYIGGLVDMGSGHLHPLNLVLGEAKAAIDCGAQLFEQSAVTDIEYGPTVHVKTANGSVRCDKLIICGNAHVAGLNPKLEGKVLPAGSYVIATESLPEDLARKLLPQNMGVCDQRVALDYYRLSADNRLIFGGLCNYSGRDPASIVGALKPNMDKVFPYLKDIKVDYQWGGMIGIGANRMPQIGRLMENVYFAQAYSGHGINATHMAARVIAEHIEGESDRMLTFERIHHMRFPGGRRFRSPLLAVGMLYHRAKDLV